MNVDSVIAAGRSPVSLSPPTPSATLTLGQVEGLVERVFDEARPRDQRRRIRRIRSAEGGLNVRTEFDQDPPMRAGKGLASTVTGLLYVAEIRISPEMVGKINSKHGVTVDEVNALATGNVRGVWHHDEKYGWRLLIVGDVAPRRRLQNL